MRVMARIFALLLAMTASFTFADYSIETSSRVVAFADVHGAYDDWTTLLQELGVVDAQLNWSAGNTHLISLGDLIDRGPGSQAQRL